MVSRLLAAAAVGAAGAIAAQLLLKKRSVIRHHVLLKLKPETTDATVDLILARLRLMPATIPSIRRIEVGRQIKEVSRHEEANHTTRTWTRALRA